MINLLALFILAACWVVPDHFPPWTAFHTEAPAFVAAALALVVVLRWNRHRLALPSAVVFLVVLGGTAAVQWAFGQISYGGDAVVVIAYLGALISAWLWGHSWILNRRKVDLLTCVCVLLLAAGLLTAFQVLTQWLQVEYAMNDWVLEGLRGGRPRANVGQPNQAATALMMATVAAAVLCHRRRIGTAGMWLAAILLGLAVTLTQSRTALLSAVLLGALYLLMSNGTARSAVSRGAVLLWLVLLLGATLTFPLWNWDASVGGLNLDQMAKGGTRPLIWRQMIAGLLQSPWWGWGWLQAPTAQQAGAMLVPGVEQTNYAHNALLDLYVWLGIPVVTTLVLLALGWGARRFNKGLASTEVLSAFLLLLPFLVHSQLELPHTYAYFLVVAGVLLGAMDAWTGDASSIVLQTPRRVAVAAVIAWVGLLVSIGYEYTLVEEDFRINRFENRSIGTTPAEYQVPRVYLVTQLGELLQVMRMRAEPGMAQRDVDMLLRVARRYTWAPVQFRAALALGLNGRPEDASQRLAVLKNLFGDSTYLEAKANWKTMLLKYPTLLEVGVP